jgi:hypothetical protein
MEFKKLIFIEMEDIWQYSFSEKQFKQKLSVKKCVRLLFRTNICLTLQRKINSKNNIIFTLYCGLKML